MLNDRIVAVGLLTQGDVALLGPTFDRAWPIDEAPCFTGLLEAIDKADRNLRPATDSTGGELWPCVRWFNPPPAKVD